MVPEFSEFSYGFALVNELVGWTALRSAPIFPTLVEEGKPGGGYDVKLDYPAAPLFLQFKRADCMSRKSAREIREYKLDINRPFHRFPITLNSKSRQHQSLLRHAENGNCVYYVAPRFHRISEINNFYSSQNVANQSIFIDPSEIGQINDDAQHYVSYDRWQTYFCSKPRKINATISQELQRKLTKKLDDDKRPLRSILHELGAEIDRSATEANELEEVIRRDAAKRSKDTENTDIPQDVEEEPLPPQNDFKISPPKELSPENSLLQKIADKAMTQFGAQLIIAQKHEDSGLNSNP